MTWRNLLFPFLNPKFGVVTAVIYVLLAWAVNVDMSQYRFGQFGESVRASTTGLVNSQGAVTWFFLLILGFIFFTETHSRWFRWIGGTLHALAHLWAVFGLGWAATYITVVKWGCDFGSISQLLSAGALIGISAWFVGPMIMGIYFLISLNVFGRHSNEAFSSIRSPDWKSFLRMKVTKDGLTIYPIGIQRVCRSWAIHPGGPESPEWVPDSGAARDKQGTPPTLIETPIHVSARQG